ncbi:hypothetical protein lacNasYZ03_18860 [Lactobacillus nasalidis]|uniref:MP1 n=1 Tax=Lactobacillus nasalidis TaxID=2797258 RepID=A0ABQ3WAT5_9LACO|nr:hypothetical protein [Lactobacillus nasalidis]GHV98090.1 hypothetical protein lacNasYZ01_12720 [Lactobacillus nasalidis]GHV99333.1 hypothetical protein lacNasYZ02_07630 [Lactobacillus nasalidis]GHW02199.1 hypothetical protein lacNasYZ03_18860 [Lactobacillus nasalidis]
MSFSTIVLLVLAAIVALALLSVFFKALIALLPVGLVVVLVLWLYYRFYWRKKHDLPDRPDPDPFSRYQSADPQRPRKRAQDVTIRDVDDSEAKNDEHGKTN